MEKNANAQIAFPAFLSFVGQVLQPLAGYILDFQWDGTIIDGARIYDVVHYQYALSILPIACVLSLIAAILLKEKH